MGARTEFFPPELTAGPVGIRGSEPASHPHAAPRGQVATRKSFSMRPSIANQLITATRLAQRAGTTGRHLRLLSLCGADKRLADKIKRLVS